MAKVLFVSQGPGAWETLQRRLIDAGHQAESLACANGATDAIEQAKPNVVVVVASSGPQVALDLLARIRHRPDLLHIPILIWSDRFDPALEQTARQLGATECLTADTDPRLQSTGLDHYLRAYDTPAS